MDFEDETNNVAHHGLPILTQRELDICQAMSIWIETARQHNTWNGKNWLPGMPDIVKSRLFWRIRSGKKPLPSPPPTAYSCPWYELIDEPGRPHWAYDYSEHEGRVAFAQCGYELLERDARGAPSRVKFGPYEFKCWRGPSENGSHEGWWLQYQPSA